MFAASTASSGRSIEDVVVRVDGVHGVDGVDGAPVGVPVGVPVSVPVSVAQDPLLGL
jgi:hypothetical protein